VEKIFLFDIGKVIVKGHDHKALYEAMHCDCTYEEFKNIFTNSKLYRDTETGLISTDQYIDELKNLTGSKIRKDDYIDLHNKNKQEYYDTTLSLIKHLKSKGYKIGILSNLKKMDVEYFMKTYETDIFDYEFYSCFVHAMKPSDDIYEMVSRVVKPNENEVYFFDDLEENCEGAKRYGIHAIQTTGETILEDYKKYVRESE
jgi:putative hydrolase of the HAD superfamily